jgi:glycosyltransferase involved in cell wall biosynthesis
LIVVEDGTHDRTESIVADFSHQGAQPVYFLRHATNQGLPATRNTGIALARSPWIVLLDQDDLWAPEHLASLLGCAREHPAANLIHSGSVLFDSDSGRELDVRAPSPEVVADFPLSLFLGDYCIQPSSVMLARSLWEQVGGFNATFRYVEDREMWMRCAQAGAVLAYTGRNTCLYRKHATSLSTNAAPMALACARVFDQAADWASIPRRLRRRHAAEAWISAGRLQWRSDPAAAHLYFARAWARRPTLRALGYSIAAFCLSHWPRQRRRAFPAHE